MPILNRFARGAIQWRTEDLGEVQDGKTKLVNCVFCGLGNEKIPEEN